MQHDRYHVGPRVQVVLVMDQAGWRVAKHLAVSNNITLLFPPPYSPELNPVERLWCWLEEHDRSNHVQADYEALLEAGTTTWNQLTPKRVKSVGHRSWVEPANQSG